MSVIYPVKRLASILGRLYLYSYHQELILRLESVICVSNECVSFDNRGKCFIKILKYMVYLLIVI